MVHGRLIVAERRDGLPLLRVAVFSKPIARAVNEMVTRCVATRNLGREDYYTQVLVWGRGARHGKSVSPQETQDLVDVARHRPSTLTMEPESQHHLRACWLRSRHCRGAHSLWWVGSASLQSDSPAQQFGRPWFQAMVLALPYAGPTFALVQLESAFPCLGSRMDTGGSCMKCICDLRVHRAGASTGMHSHCLPRL
jgi:hypothetical protein